MSSIGCWMRWGSPDPAFHLFVVLAATTGARRAQVLGLRWRDVDLDHRRVSFCGGWVEGEHGPVLTTTKNKRRYAVEIDGTTASLFAGHLAAFDDPLPDPDSFIFTKAADGRVAWRPNWVTKTFLRYQRAAELRPFRLHDLRHFMATQMLDLGVPVTVVARRLDHRRVSTTLDFYSHVISGHDGFAAEHLARTLHGSPVVGERSPLGAPDPTASASGGPATLVAVIASGVRFTHERCVDDLAGTEQS